MLGTTKETRLVRSRRFLNKIKNPAEQVMLWFFSDKKNFDQGQKFKKTEGMTDGYMFISPKFKESMHKKKLLTTITVLGIVSNEEHVIPLHFFPQ